MKTLTLRYKSYGKEFVFDSVRDAFSGKAQDEKDVMYFNDLNSMYRFLTPVRAEILGVIKNQNPSSIYDLALKLGKDQGYISKEVKLLKELGIIELISEKHDGRERLVPVLKFDRVVFDVGIDDMIQYSKASSE